MQRRCSHLRDIKSPGEREETGNNDKSSSKECHEGTCHSEGVYGERAPLTDDYVDAGTDAKSEDPRSASYETEELQYTDMYLNSRCESKDSTSVADVEPHYITTHEIQLSGVGSRCGLRVWSRILLGFRG